MALDQAEGLYAFDVIEHIEGKKNVLADALSRLHEPGGVAEVPTELTDVLRDWPPPRVNGLWKVWEPRRSLDAVGLPDGEALGVGG